MQLCIFKHCSAEGLRMKIGLKIKWKSWNLSKWKRPMCLSGSKHQFLWAFLKRIYEMHIRTDDWELNKQAQLGTSVE